MPPRSSSATCAGPHAQAPHLLVRLTAPAHFVLAFVAGAVLQALLGLPLPHGIALQAMWAVGTVLSLLGLALALACLGLFAWRRTAILPTGLPARLVVRGPYRFSRNPMYLSLVLSYAGLCGLLSLPWALPLLAWPLWVLQARMIPFEEQRLQWRFGSDFERYRQHTRRWL